MIVSNRVAIPGERGASVGGLFVAPGDLLTPGSVWFAWSGRLAEEAAPRPVAVEAGGVTYATVDLTTEAYRGWLVAITSTASV